jgi:heme-degrading monooxygenase HmoA
VILEMATFTVHAGQQPAFEAAFEKAQRLLGGLDGYLSHELQRSVERDAHYALLIEWRALEDRSRGFHRTNESARWRELLLDFLADGPQIEYFRAVAPRRAVDLGLHD